MTPTTVLFSMHQLSAFCSMVTRPSAAGAPAGVHSRRARALPPARRQGCRAAVPLSLGALRTVTVGRAAHEPNWRRPVAPRCAVSGLPSVRESVRGTGAAARRSRGARAANIFAWLTLLVLGLIMQYSPIKPNDSQLRYQTQAGFDLCSTRV